MERKSFKFVRQLIEAERYKNYKKDYWGGADGLFFQIVINRINIGEDSYERIDRLRTCKTQRYYQFL